MGMINYTAQGVGMPSLQSYINKISVASSEQDIFNICADIADSLDTSYFTYSLIQPNNFHSIKYKIISNRNDHWIDRYKKQSYIFIDPTVRECMQLYTPVFWSTQKYKLEKISIKAKAMIEDAHEHKLRAGILAPAFDSSGISGMFGIGLDVELYTSSSQEYLVQIAPYINYLGGYIHQSMIKFWSRVNCHQKEPLTNREKDCLCWAADGKTASEIGSKLYISENTVKFHSKNIMKKLGARNTAQALAIGILNGIIQPVTES